MNQATRALLIPALVLMGLWAPALVSGHPLDCKGVGLECEGSLESRFGVLLGQQELGPFCGTDGRRYREGFVYEIAVGTATEIVLEQESTPDSTTTVYLLSDCETDSCLVFSGGEEGENLTSCVEPGIYYAVIVNTDPFNAPATFKLTLGCSPCSLVPARPSSWGLLKTGFVTRGNR